MAGLPQRASFSYYLSFASDRGRDSLFNPGRVCQGSLERSETENFSLSMFGFRQEEGLSMSWKIFFHLSGVLPDAILD